MPPSAKTLSGLQDMGDLGSSRSGRVLQSIRRDSDIKGRLFRDRRRNEEILSLAYQDGTALGGDTEWANVRENALNLPYRWVRWFESQATSKKMIVKVNRDAGAGQRPGGQRRPQHPAPRPSHHFFPPLERSDAAPRRRGRGGSALFC